MKQSAFLVLFFISFFTFSQQALSQFANGDWYKLAVTETGIHQITYNDLIGYGMDPTTVDPRNIVLFGKAAGMLSETFPDSNIPVIDELAIFIQGEDDGVFDPEDYILFYGQSPVVWNYDTDQKQYHHQKNYYTDKAYYFISVSDSAGKRIQTQQSTNVPYTAIIDYFDLLIFHELDCINPGKSGKQWLGETFQENSNLSFEYDLGNYLIEPSETFFRSGLAGNSTEISSVDITINDTQFPGIELFPIPANNSYQLYRPKEFDTNGFTVDGDLEITFTYNQPNDSSLAWLDFFDLRLKAAPWLKADQMDFRTDENIGVDSISYFYFMDDLDGELNVWNVTDPLNTSSIALQIDDTQIWFQLETNEMLQFQAFNGLSYMEPVFKQKIENQDLLSMSTPGYLIITHPDFVDEAEQLKTLHADDLTTNIVTTEEIFNEFSSGESDISAIRNFIWYLHENSDNDTLEYVLLFGDASYDYKNRIENNSNFVPTFESRQSSNVVHSFATDRFYSVKDMDEPNQEQLAVGRIPVSSVEKAGEMVSKIESYTSSTSLGAWKNETMFIGDDGDNNLHQSQADYLADITEDNSPVFNITKTYLDFFELVQTDEGPRYPEVNAEIEQKTNDGVFYINYNGHGGSKVLAQEKVVTIPDMDNWINEDKLPLWVISSADVARYDDPEFLSLGESLFLKENGGAISVISTSRPNFASANFALNKKILEKFTNESLQQGLRFGDLFNNPINGDNDLKWTLLGDPALKISFPEFGIQTLKVNDIDISMFVDTISPGSTLKLEGQVADKDEQMLQSWFNGNIYLKVYAPPYIRETMGNQNPVTEVIVQDSILVEATGTVIDGEFELEVILPALYFEDFGNLKLSWYAEIGETDANGFYSGIEFGGTPVTVNEFEFIAENIQAYPSPFNDYLTIDLPKTETGEFTISVYDMMGVMVYSEEANNNSEREQIDLSFLTKGIYLVNVSNQLGAKSIKILKH